MARRTVTNYIKSKRKKRPGIHSKNRSRGKWSKQYKKPYASQGRP